MLELTPVGKIFACVLVALIIFLVTAMLVGEERKALWFKKRTKYSFFLRRGIIGEILHFGYPRTIEGGLVTLAMFVLIGITSFIIVNYL